MKEEARAGAAVLHFAAHAVVDEAHPEQSALLLAPDPGVEDGRLQPREFPELGLARRIVVLSGCSSARGPVLAGEGVLSLARSFFATGAVAVIGSLWPLRDDEAAVFFDRFYAHLAEGESLSGSLAAAQRDALAAGGPTAAWAGVVLLGDGDLVVGGIQGWRLGAWSWALCVVLGAGVLLLGVARFRRFVRRASAA